MPNRRWMRATPLRRHGITAILATRSAARPTQGTNYDRLQRIKRKPDPHRQLIFRQSVGGQL